MLDSDLDFIRCPKCIDTLELRYADYSNGESKGALVCKKCTQQYQIKEFIPQLFFEENISKRDLFFTYQADDYSRYYNALLKFFGFLMFLGNPVFVKNSSKSKELRKEVECWILYRTRKQSSTFEEVSKEKWRTCCHRPFRRNDN